MITYELHSGRLGEICFAGRITEEDVQGMIQSARAMAPRLSAPLALCVDITRCRLLTAPIADMVTHVMRRSNAHIERLAFLLPPEGAVVLLQVERMIRETGHPCMRTFRDGLLLEHWLGEILDSAEQARLRDFLATEHSQASPDR